ncbi:MAG: hypothetical protein AMJ93_07585 [Anaerolineae bacterium SM23_84]|nr:MAG: hypothetical protein AMJ93_07585 [Anaerolineae bacterium SM23_84]
MTGDVQVSLVTGLCILVLAVASKWIVHAELDFVSQYAPVWVYIAYILSPSRDEESHRRSKFWSVAIILVTLAVIAVYSFAL